MSPAAPWVLLRGLTRESRHWGGFPDQLRAAMPGADVAAIDLPGNGRLHGERSPDTVEAMADAARAELRRQGLAPPYRLLAMSLGAMVAVAWAARHPQELAGAALINTSLRPFSPPWQRLRPRAWGPLLRLAALDPEPAAWEATILELTSRGVAEPAALLADWGAWRRECPVSRGNALRQLIAAARFQAPSERPAPPLLLLASQRDGLVDPRCSRRLAAAWGLPLALHTSAGHDLPLDDGAWVASQLARWVAEAAPQSPQVLRSLP